MECKIQKHLKVEIVDRRFFLQEDFIYIFEYLGKENTIIVPAGFNTDGFSTPKLFKPFQSETGKGIEIAVVHDFLYSKQSPAHITRADADMAFLQGLECLGVSKFKRYAMYVAVRLFGKPKYKKR